jgi:hypothetical protein
MKQVIFAMLVVFFCATASFASDLRCVNGLVDIGDHSFEVLKTCGEPVTKDVVGYTLTRDRERELKVEQWVYGPKDGYYYILTFEGGILTKVKDFRSP